jgi:mono/diheme cytochrome c family protein
MTWAGAALAGLALWGCSEAEMPQPQDGRALYMQHCAGCHGSNGTGAGALAAGLAEVPADLTAIGRRAPQGFDRAAVMSKVDGYARATPAHAGMPAFGALLTGDLIPFDSGDGIQTPTPRKLVALVAYLEAIQR